MHRGMVTPAAGRSPLMTETQLFNAAFFVRTVVEGLSLSLPPFPEPPHAARTDVRLMSATATTTLGRDFLKRDVFDMTPL